MIFQVYKEKGLHLYLQKMISAIQLNEYYVNTFE